MKTIGIIANKDKDNNFKYTEIVIKSICSKGGKVNLPYEVANSIGCASDNLSEEDVIDNSDIIICLGGDGTFLKAARKIYQKNKPMLGINLGSLGFLTEVDTNDIDAAIVNLLNDEYEIEERMMLEATTIRGNEIIGTDIVLNDVVISRGELSRILHVKTYINNVFVDAFPGDGIIISSPTGSTAYSLSAGGPIVEPDIDLIIVTPICSHILYSRSFITAGDRSVKAIVDESYGFDAIVTVDGQKCYKIKGGDIVQVKKANYTVKLVRINSRNFFNILRSKIFYRGESIRKNEI